LRIAYSTTYSFNHQFKVMNSFVKTMLATMLGMFLYFVIITALTLMSIVGMVASGSQAQEVADNSVLVLQLKGTITEQPTASSELSSLFGNNFEEQALTEIIDAIAKAKDNDNIKGIYIEAGALQAGIPTLAEIRQKLAEFKQNGKWIVAYGDTYTQGAYYVSTVADKIYLNPKGSLDWHGIASMPMFMKDLYAKLGVKYRVMKVGTFKSATEYYTETQMSDANRLQVKEYIDGIWTNICDAVAKSRKISVAKLNEYADRYMVFEEAAEVKKLGFVDDLLYADQLKAEVKKRLGLDDDETVSQVSVKGMKDVKRKMHDGDEIAVYYASGTIVSVPGQGLGDSEIVSKTVADELNELADDEDVKAVVLRVNSPGGDAYASEQLWRAVEQLKSKKPVVVSMGDYAASGGYYMSCAASWIVAQPTTLTGSIGIYAAIPELSELMTQKLGIHFDEVSTNAHSGFGNVMARPLNDYEVDVLQNYVNRGYDLFLKRVAEGRKQPADYINTIAQGRVWTGQAAIKNKLVDELGGIDTAVKKAAELAKAKEYYTQEYPAPQGFMESLLEQADGSDNYIDGQLKEALGTLYYPLAVLHSGNNEATLQARLPFELNVK